MGQARFRFASTAVAFTIVSLALLGAFPSCAARGGTIKLDTEGFFSLRLESIATAKALPSGWKLALPGEDADIVLSLEARPSPSPSCGLAYRAAAVDLGDDRYSVPSAEAEKIGLVDLESIEPPRRALAVDGLWPGESGYPFTYDLHLVARSREGSKLPRAIELWAEAAAEAADSMAPKPMRLAAAGDMQIGEAQGPFLLSGRSGLSSIISPDLLANIDSADIAVANLESPISSRGEPNPEKRYHFRMPPGSAKAFKEAGFDLLLFGNNHAFDYGAEGFSDTLTELSGAGMPMVGAGKDLKEAAAARYIEAGPGENLAFVGFAFYPKESLGFSISEAAAGAGKMGVCADEEAALASIRAARAGGATVVVLAHGGTEYVESPNKRAKELYARFVDAGAALVLGSHPHVLQGCQARSGSLIAYSLGNFVFTLEDEPPAAWKSIVLELLVYKGKVRALGLIPIVAGYMGTELDPDVTDAQRRFSLLCAKLE
jgi:poly-gamma-glutamate capsule biosynthesis protein CapA/YwtB (metallophosphatase superfamily)